MNNEPRNPFIINIAIAGYLPEDKHLKDALLAKIVRVLNSTVKFIKSHSAADQQSTEINPTVNFLSSALITGTSLIEELKSHPEYNFKFIGITDADKTDSRRPYLDQESILEPEDNHFISNKSLIFSWICDQADYSILIRDDDNQLLFDFLKYCKQSSVPAVSIDKEIDRPMLWTETSYYDSYDDDKLQKYLNSILEFSEADKNAEAAKVALKRKFLWDHWYSRYIKKYKASAAEPKSIVKDSIIDESTSIPALGDKAEATRKTLAKWFRTFDDNAILFADKYRASIYLRAVIPLLVTVILSVGFYLETLLSPWPLTVPGVNLQIWSVIAGFAFFFHAVFNLYIYRLSVNKIIHAWHINFLENRFIAEKLRIAVHFIPFGIPVNFITNHYKYGAKAKYNKKVINQLRSIIKEAGLPVSDYQKIDYTECLYYLEELVNDQLEYHQKSEKRYLSIIKNLKLYGKIIFYLGFLFVLFRGVLQLFFSFMKIPVKINGHELQPIIKAFANMLALLFPAWAAYFTSKLSYCNFEELYHNDVQMLEELSSLKQMIHDEKQKQRLSYSDLYYLAKDVTNLLSGENREWYSQINAKTVNKL